MFLHAKVTTMFDGFLRNSILKKFCIMFCMLCNHGLFACDESQEYDLLRIIQTSFSQNLQIFQNFENIMFSYGTYQRTYGEFDPHFVYTFYKARNAYPYVNDFVPPSIDTHEIENIHGVDLAFEKKFMTGVFIRPTVTIERVGDNFQSPYYQTSGQAFLNIDVPFLRGSGVENVAADVIAAGFQYEATSLFWRYEVSRILSSIVVSYWSYVFDLEKITYYEESVRQTETILEGLITLVNSGELPIIELPQVRGDLATKKELLLRARQDAYANEERLKVFMNIDPHTEIDISIATYRFPSFTEVEVLSNKICLLIQEALVNRADYLASELNIRAAEALLTRAFNDMYPRVDMQAVVGLNGLDTGRQVYYSSLNNRVKGPQYRVALVIESPIYQYAEKGNLNEKKANVADAKATTLDLYNNIVADVKIITSALNTHVARKVQLDKAVSEQELALRDELFKFKEGLSTVFNITQRTDRLLSSQIQRVEHMKSFIADIIGLRFKMGIIVPNYGRICELNVDNFITLPNSSNL